MGAFLNKPLWRRSLATAALLVWAVFASAPAGAFSLSGIRNSMIDFLLEQISTPGSFEVKAERVEDAEDGSTSLVGVTVADGQGVWMSIESAALSWNPGRLLRGEVEINSLTITGLSMTRNPTPLPAEEEPEPEEDAGGLSFDWPRSPITLRVRQVSLRNIHLAEGVAPQEIRFNGEGDARDEGEIQALKLAIQRIDAVEGVIDLDYERNFDNDHLRFRLTAREAAGGVVATAAGLPADAASQVTLNADGPPEDWRVDLNAHVDRMIDVVGAARISYAGPLSAVADFSLTPGPDLGEAAQVAFSPAATLKIDAGEGEDGTLDIRVAEIASPALSLVADGSLSRRDGAMDLGVRLSVERAMAGLVEGVDFARVSFDGKALGAPADLTLTGDFQILELATAPADIGRLALNAEVLKTGERITVKGAGQADGLRLDQLQPATLGPAQLTLDATLEGDSATLTTLKLESRVLQVAVEGGADLAAETLAVDYRVAAPDLAPVAASYGAEASGDFAATGAARGTFSAPRVDGELSLTGARVADRNLGALTIAHQIALDEALKADVTAAFRGSEFGDADLVANAVLAGETLEAGYTLTAADLSQAGEAIGTPLSGALTAEGAAKGLLSALSLTGETRIERASAAGTGLGEVTLRHDVALGEAISGDVSLALAGSDYGDARVATGFALAGETLKLDGLTADALELSAEGGATVDLAATTVDGKIRASGGLSGLQRVTGSKINGAMKADLTLTAPEGRQAATLNASVENLRTEGAAVERITLTGRGRDLTGEPALAAELAVAGVDAGDATVETLTVKADGPLSALAVALNAVGEASGNDLNAEAEALVDASGPETSVTVSNLNVAVAEERFALSSIMTVTSGGGTTRITGLDLGLPDDGRLEGEAALFPNGASGDIRLTGFTMGTMKRLGLNVFDDGVTDFSAKFDTRAGRAGADVTLTGRGFSTHGAMQHSGQALDLDATALWDGRTLNADLKMVGPAGRPLTARAALPLRPTGSIMPAPPRGAEIDAALDWNGRIERIWALVPATGHILRGETDIALTVTGPLDAPHVGGRLAITDGAYENLDLGTLLTDLNVETTIAEGRDIGLNLSASDGAGGRVEGTASIALSGPNEGLDVRVSTQSATLVRRDDATARLNGAVAVTGPLNDILVKGEIEIQGAEIRLVNSSPPGVVTLGDVLIKGEEEAEEQEAAQSLVMLDMRVFAERKIFVRGRGLDSEWRADINIDGPASDPQIVGSVERVRGSLDLLGKNFVLERGAAIFTGPADPELDVMLTRETNDFTGRIVVNRTASDPAISFTSDPVVPEEEVLPMAIFGKSSQSLSAAQGIQLALGVATLMDGGDGTLGDIRGALGVDVLSLDTDDDGEQEVNVGSYIADGVYVGAKQSLGGGSSVVVEIDLMDNVTVDVETGSTSGESVGLNWKYDF